MMKWRRIGLLCRRIIAAHDGGEPVSNTQRGEQWQRECARFVGNTRKRYAEFEKTIQASAYPWIQPRVTTVVSSVCRGEESQRPLVKLCRNVLAQRPCDQDLDTVTDPVTNPRFAHRIPPEPAKHNVDTGGEVGSGIGEGAVEVNENRVLH